MSTTTGRNTDEEIQVTGTEERFGTNLVARLPIFDEHQELFGYEIVSPSQLPHGLSFVERDETCNQVIADGTLLMDWGVLTAGKVALVHVTRNVLLDGHVRLLPHKTVVKLSATAEADRTVVAACEELRREGYGLALDFTFRGFASHPLLAAANIALVDPTQNDPSNAQAVSRWRDETGGQLLATGVETRQAFREAQRVGFDLFQGFYFAQPAIVSARDVPATKTRLLSILREVNQRDMDYEKVESRIRQDPGLCYKLLRYINAASHGVRHEITSIRRALVQLGEREIRRWVSLCVLTMTAEDRPPELILLGLVRARFGEAVAPLFGLEQRSDDLFLLGILSIIDAVLGRPMEETLEPLPIQEDIKRALVTGEGPLRPVFRLITDFARGRWSDVEGVIPEPQRQEVARHYLLALDWAARLAAVN